MAVLKTLTPQRGQTLADGTPNPIRNMDETLFVQVERTRDEVSGKHPVRYFEAYVIDYTDIPVCTTTGGVSAGVGATAVSPNLPKNTKILSAYMDIITPFVNSAASQEIAQVAVGATELFSDATLTAAAQFKAASATLPLKLSAAVPIYVYFEGADTVTYTAGRAILYVEVLSYFDE